MDDVVITLKGRINSNNSDAVEQDIFAQLEGKEKHPVVVDMTDLEYISSAGLRVLLRIKKTHPSLTITNVNSDVYDILDTTGFTQMMKVEKAYRSVSVDGCEVVGIGANGIVYRIDQDTVVKVYSNANALEEIKHEREVARLALILGLPTAISYDVVRVGDSYGSVFELLNARSFTKLLINEPEKMDWVVKEFVDLLKKIHRTEVDPGQLPEMKDFGLGICDDLEKSGHLSVEKAAKLRVLMNGLPRSNHLVHGDYHTKNVMLQGDEVLLIDMDTLSTGHPIFELAFMFNAFQGYSTYDHEQIMRFQGFSYETGAKFWHSVLVSYLGTENEARIKEVEDKAKVIGYARMIRGNIRKGAMDTEVGRAEVEAWTEKLLPLLDEVDSLLFNPYSIEVEAKTDNLNEVQAFIDLHLEESGCSMRTQMQIALAVEEIFVNIAHYAYAPKTGKATVRVEVSDEPAVFITFLDNGIPYNPLEKKDPDVTLTAEERSIGGLGVFLTKKTMDDVTYEYKDGQNILRLKKNL